MAQCHFQVYKDSAGYWRWRLRDTNGKIIADSAESYYEKSGAVAGINNVCSCCQNAVIVDA